MFAGVSVPRDEKVKVSGHIAKDVLNGVIVGLRVMGGDVHLISFQEREGWPPLAGRPRGEAWSGTFRLTGKGFLGLSLERLKVAA